MSELGAYALSITGIIILGVLVDLMLVEGQMQKYVKSIFSVFVVFVALAPIPKLLNLKIDLKTSITDNVAVDEQLLNKITSQKSEQVENLLLDHFETQGVSGVKIDVVFDKATAYLPSKIVLDIKNLVINSNFLNINRYEILTGLVQDVVAVQKDVIEFYE